MADALFTSKGRSRDGAHKRAAAETLAAAFPALLVEAERLAATVIAGDHGRRQSGTGETFWQYRHFRQGDPRTSVDWRQSARSEHYYVRETEWELAQSVWMWNDRSPSMAYHSHLSDEPKERRAAVLALATSLLLTRGGERVGDLSQDDRARSGEAALQGISRSVMRLDNSLTALPQVDQRFRRANIVIFSDLLRPASELAEFIAAAAGQGAHGHIVQVFDPAEETWPFEGRVLFEGSYAGHELLTGRAELLRANYRLKLEEHRDQIGEAARRAGWSFLVHHTDASAQTILLPLYGRLAGESGLSRMEGGVG